MESISKSQAEQIYSVYKYKFMTQKTCYEKCVVDFQTKDISAMEKECANSCIKKHMTIMKDVAGF